MRPQIYFILLIFALSACNAVEPASGHSASHNEKTDLRPQASAVAAIPPVECNADRLLLSPDGKQLIVFGKPIGSDAEKEVPFRTYDHILDNVTYSAYNSIPFSEHVLFVDASRLRETVGNHVEEYDSHTGKLLKRYAAGPDEQPCNKNANFPIGFNNPSLLPICVARRDKAVGLMTDNGAFVADPVWKASDIQAISNALVQFDQDGRIYAVIERQPLTNFALAIWWTPHKRFALNPSDYTSHYALTELEDGSKAVWNEADPAEEIALNGDQDQKIKFAPVDLQTSILTTSWGKAFSRTGFASKYDLEAPTGSPAAPAQRIKSVTLFETQASEVTAALTQSANSSLTISITAPHSNPATITCQANITGPDVQLVRLQSKSFGPFIALWHRNLTAPAAPLAVVLHGGPKDSVTFPNSIPPLQREGFQTLDIEYPGSGGWGRKFRGALDNNVQTVAGETIGAVRNWLDGRSLNTGYQPLLFGGSYGAFLGMATLAEDSHFSSIWLDSGPYFSQEFKLLNVVAAAIPGNQYYIAHTYDPYQFERKYYGPAVYINRIRNKNIKFVITYDRRDPVVSYRNSEKLVKLLQENAFNVSAFASDTGIHCDPENFYRAEASHAVFADFRNRAGPFIDKYSETDTASKR